MVYSCLLYTSGEVAEGDVRQEVVDENQTYQCIPLFLMAYRSSVHDTTGMTPAKLAFGREICLPGDLMFTVL